VISLAALAVERAPAGETEWPPVLVYFAVFLLVVALGAVTTMFLRARATTRRDR
jgi:hypothetical protein